LTDDFDKAIRAVHDDSELSAARASDPLNSPEASLVELIEAVRALPYGRPSERTVEGMLRERRGTCSTKHLFLAQRLAERFPETEPLIVHRVYRLERATARQHYGEQVAQTVPEDSCLVDVHRYLTILLDGQRVAIDATFPGPAWDGRSALPLASGAGDDYPASGDPDADKRALEAKLCDPAIRERFITALTTTRVS
jgi:hypothetical protein